jgi:hypothetical protein
LVACCKASPAALYIAALTPPPPAFNLLHESYRYHLQIHDRGRRALTIFACKRQKQKVQFDYKQE